MLNALQDDGTLAFPHDAELEQFSALDQKGLLTEDEQQHFKELGAAKKAFETHNHTFKHAMKSGNLVLANATARKMLKIAGGR